MTELSKTYDPKEVEQRLYAEWEQAGYFRGEVDKAKEPFCVVMPPPNITGSLHLGHALDNSLPDILVRAARMRGKSALYLPGTDHAGIATHVVVERELAKEGKTRYDLGREKFVESVWEWREQYGRSITEQLRRLGISCDWSRERFTLDPGLSDAVRKVFVDLYNEGLIYRGNRIINWCPVCETALSDAELDHSDETGELVWFRYPLEGGGEITVATTRLETMLGDSGIAVHPDDERYAGMVGRHAIHPFFDRKLPVVSDEVVDPTFGSGAVKVTPAHDATDFEIGERHNLEKINIFDTTASVVAEGPFKGLDRLDAREAIRKALDEKGLLDRSDPHDHAVARCERSQTVIEPWLSEQWFVKMQPLAAPAIEAVSSGRLKFHPERWTSYYLNWMSQIRDWCISRQLWWGHRIPVFYCDECDHSWAAIEDPTQCPNCNSSKLTQDPDVLDTWFSSGLWPFSTLGWPEKSEDLDFFYPTVVIVPGYEIIHLWVARMIAFGLHFMKEVPFRTAYIHGIVRDSEGRKMSKSLGNTVDPLELIDHYGTDALRFMLTEHATGQDIYLNDEWMQGARNFANKLWNASRFVLMNLEDVNEGLPQAAEMSLADRWVLARWSAAAGEYDAQLDGLDLAGAAKNIYSFIWNEFCDWYIEAAKVGLRGDGAASTKRVLRWTLDASLRLLHPIMPFVTEEIWQKLPGNAGKTIVLAPWPSLDPALVDLEAEESFARVQDVVGALRSFRADHGVDPGRKIEAALAGPGSKALQHDGATIRELAGLERLDFAEVVEGAHARLVTASVDVLVPFAGAVDIAEELKRLQKRLDQKHGEVLKLAAKLANEGFVNKAPADVVADHELRLGRARDAEVKLRAQLDSLTG